MRVPGEDVPTAKVRVFVADDELVIAQTLASILDLAGYDVCAVYGGEAALRLINLFKPSLVITDITVPGVITREITSPEYLKLPRCKILLFTGHADLHDLLRTEDAVSLPFDLVTKPVQPGDLLSLIRGSLCSDHPPLLVPMDTHAAQVH